MKIPQSPELVESPNPEVRESLWVRSCEEGLCDVEIRRNAVDETRSPGVDDEFTWEKLAPQRQEDVEAFRAGRIDSVVP